MLVYACAVVACVHFFIGNPRCHGKIVFCTCVEVVAGKEIPRLGGSIMCKCRRVWSFGNTDRWIGCITFPVLRSRPSASTRCKSGKVRCNMSTTGEMKPMTSIAKPFPSEARPLVVASAATLFSNSLMVLLLFVALLPFYLVAVSVLQI